MWTIVLRYVPRITYHARMDLITIAEAASLLNVSPDAILRRVQAGEYGPVRVTPRLWLVRRDLVQADAPGGRPRGPKSASR